MQYSATANASSTTKLISLLSVLDILEQGRSLRTYVRFSPTSVGDVVEHISLSRLLPYADFYFRFPQLPSASYVLCILHFSPCLHVSLTFSFLSFSLSTSLFLFLHTSAFVYPSVHAVNASDVSNIYKISS